MSLSRPRMNLHLARFSARRALAGAILPLFAAVAIFAILHDWAPSPTLVAEGTLDLRSLESALARQGTWMYLLLGVVPLLGARVARTVTGWMSGESHWLGTGKLTTGGALVSSLLGSAAAALFLVTAFFLVAELAAGGSAPALRDAGPLFQLGEADGEGWTAEDPGAPPGSFARTEVFLAGGSGPVADIEVRVARVGSSAVASAKRKVSGRTRIDVPLPAGPGALRLTLRTGDSGALVATAREDTRLLVPAGSDRWAGFEVAARALSMLIAWLGLCLGLGAWTSPVTACLLVLCAWIPAWLEEEPPHWLPGADLPAALATVGEGLVPAAVSPVSLGVAALLALVGLALGRLRLRDWSSA